MCFFRSKRIEIKLFTFLLAYLIVGQSIVAFCGSDRIYPSNKVTLYRGDRVVGNYTQEAPLPEGSVIASDGRCAVKLDDFYLVAEDQSLFSINTSGEQRNLFIKQGTLYFKTSAMKRAFSFITPNGPINIQRIRLDAASDASIKGYVTVAENRSELGVAEGGSMDVFTDNGIKTIAPGKKLILSQADMDIGLPEEAPPAAKQPPEPQPQEKSNRTKIAYGALGVAAIAGIALGLGGGGGGGGGGTVSPSTP